jgi:M6 family metalloprotease-like protein
MKKLYILFLPLTILILIGRLAAIPAYPYPVDKVQPDGTPITVLLKGDERVHWMESLDGYTLLYNDKQEVVFAVLDENGNLKPSKIRYKGEDLEEYSASQCNEIKEIPAKLRYSKVQVEMMSQIWKITDDMEQEQEDGAHGVFVDGIQKAPVVGEKKLLVILAQFSNKGFTYTVDDFEDLMNQFGYSRNGSTGSVRDYFRENSYGLMDFSITVVGPVQCNNTTAYYANRTSSWARGVASSADALVDFSQFAVDGAVPRYHIIFAGYGDESINNGRQIWSHKSSHAIMMLDGVSVGSTYSCSPELSGSSGSIITGIGVVCHEITHTLGAPDYYDTDYDEGGGNYQGTGDWDLMGSGGHNDRGVTPAHINMWQKILFGWVTPIELTVPTAVINMPASADSACAYWIRANANGERYILESRHKTKFDAGIPGAGLLIYHVHSASVNGSVSNRKHPQQVYPICASSLLATPTGTVGSYGNISNADCVFPGSKGKRSFGESTYPRMFSWSDTTVGVAGKDITNISSNIVNKTVSFSFKGAVLPEVECKESITELPFVWEFEDSEYLDPCYKFKAVCADSCTNLNGVYLASETEIDGAMGGNSIWLFSSEDTSSNYSQYMISPPIDIDMSVADELKFGFWYIRTRNSLESFRVGYSTTNSDTSSFIWLKTINADPVWKQDSIIIPVDAKYVALNYLGQTGRSQVGIDALTIEFVIDIDTTGVENIKLTEYNFLKIYPNPTSGKFNVVVRTPATIEIFTQSGAFIEKKLINEKAELSLQRRGLYLIRATDAKGNISTQKIIVK